MRLIDADMLYDVVQRINKRGGSITRTEYKILDRVLFEFPTIDAEPVRHGHWLFYEEPNGYYHSECSVCGQWCDEDVFLKDKWHYCPHCGAKEVNDNDTKRKD